MATNRLFRLSRTRNNRLRQVVMTESVILYAASFWVTTIEITQNRDAHFHTPNLIPLIKT